MASMQGDPRAHREHPEHAEGDERDVPDRFDQDAAGETQDLAKTRPFFDAVLTQIEQIFQHAGEIESPYLYRGNADDLAQPGTYAYLVVDGGPRPCGRLQPECYSGDDEAP